MNRVFGLELSKIDGSEKIFEADVTAELPKEYSYKDYMPEVINQGDDPICVPCSISAFINWRENLNDGSNKNNHIAYKEIYGIKTTPGEGMTFKEAFKYLRHHGVSTDFGDAKIGTYAMVKNPIDLKAAIVENGPCVGALPVYNGTPFFWKKSRYDQFYGYHAISIVGYDDEGFIIRNSWGEEFGYGGYTKISYSDFDKLIEVWTVTD